MVGAGDVGENAACPSFWLWWAKGTLILPEPYGCHDRSFCLLQSRPRSLYPPCTLGL